MSTSGHRDPTQRDEATDSARDGAAADGDERRGDAYHHGDLRRSLIAAGGALLARGGLSGVSLREVARAAGVSHNAPYRHFQSREALLAAIAADGFEQLLARMTSSIGDAEARQTSPLVAIGQVYVAFAVEFPALYRLMFSGEIRKSSFPALRVAADRTYRQLEAFIPASSASPRDMALGAWALVHGLADLITSGQISDDRQKGRLEETVGRILETYASGTGR